MALSKVDYQRKKDKQAEKVLKEIAQRIARGELETGWTHLREGMSGGEWILRVSLKETDKYNQSKKLSEVSE